MKLAAGGSGLTEFLNRHRVPLKNVKEEEDGGEDGAVKLIEGRSFILKNASRRIGKESSFFCSHQTVCPDGRWARQVPQ
jgi:hypothetical protein